MATHQLGQLFPGESELGHEAAHQLQHLPGAAVLPLVIPFVCLARGLCQGLPSEAVSSPSFAEVLECFSLARKAHRQLGQAQDQFFSILFKRKYTHTSPWQGEQPAEGMAATTRPQPCLCKGRSPVLRGSVPSRVCDGAGDPCGWALPEHSPAAPALPRAPLTFSRNNRRKRQLIVLKTSEQILGRRHSQLVGIANYLQLRKDGS